MATSQPCYENCSKDYPVKLWDKVYACRSLTVAVLCFLTLAGFTRGDETQDLRHAFANPPDDSKIVMRWWWFGGAVEKPELERELRAMKGAGIGGVEIQPVYPLELDDPQRNFRNELYLSPEFLENLQFAASKAKELGLRVDITLGSGWPYGGPDTVVTQAAGRLRLERANVPEGARSAPIPAIENGEKLIAAFVGGAPVHEIHGGRIDLPAGLSGNDVLMFFISSRTGQQVKRASLGAEGFVLDHYDQAAIAKHLTSVGEPLLRAFGDTPPHSVFSDSLEVYGSDWTPDFLEQFQKRRGYDLTPYLPALVNEMGRQSQAVRHDWAKTLTELTEENYLRPIR
ncbi:MAG: glycoside hydrolase, partial [Acidobacteriaceae bacterium]|nr:glycoside hydrolase [Acidobacteriaceae bacterium]